LTTEKGSLKSNVSRHRLPINCQPAGSRYYSEAHQMRLDAHGHSRDRERSAYTSALPANRSDAMEKPAAFASFREFYPFYLSEHENRTCRRLHFIGTSLIILIAVCAAASGRYGLLWLLPLFGYGFAWVGHFYFEHNRPATFQHPLYSLLGDFVMYSDMWGGRIRF
jgi:hypothetical protein